MTSKLPDEWFRPENAETTPAIPAVRGGISPNETTNPSLEAITPVPPPTPRSASPAPKRKSNRRTRILAVAAIVGALLLGLLIGQLLRIGDTSNPRVSTSPAAGSSPSTYSSESMYLGEVSVIAPESVAASCTAKSAQDSLGNEVTYEADLAIDADESTAWRCNGDGVGETLEFTLPEGSEVARISIVNGYDKTDPATDDLLYGQYRRITQVTWTFPDGAAVVQDLSDDETGEQVLELPTIAVDGPITLTINETTEPGLADVATRDAVLISEASFYSPAG